MQTIAANANNFKVTSKLTRTAIRMASSKHPVKSVTPPENLVNAHTQRKAKDGTDLPANMPFIC